MLTAVIEIQDAVRQRRVLSVDFPTLNESKRLTYGHQLYFELPGGVQLIDINPLVFGRVRDGVVECANTLMAAVSLKQTPLREPILVRRLENSKWLIVDGNSTRVNAVLSGWPDVPCLQEQSWRMPLHSLLFPICF